MILCVFFFLLSLSVVICLCVSVLVYLSVFCLYTCVGVSTCVNA